MDSIGAEMTREEEDLLAGDPACARLRGCVAEIDRIISESRDSESKFSNSFDCERFASDATTQKISEARSKMMDKKKDLNCFVEEIAAMLSACDTYEQEMGVLRTYGVVDGDGRLNKKFANKT